MQGELALNRLRAYSSPRIDFKGFLDSKKTGTYLGFPIVSLEKAKELDAVIIITIWDAYGVCDVLSMLKKSGFKQIYWYLNKGMRLKGRTDFLRDECLDFAALGKCILPQVEMHIADYCNLNCKGCTHFSPIFEKSLPVFSSRIDDVKKLKDKFTGILKFSILGGEPFLNPEIGMYVQEIRSILPNSYIQIVTNGLLLPKIEGNVLDSIRENGVIISISEYEPTHRIIEQIKHKLEEYEVDYVIRPHEFKEKFNLPLSLSEESQYPRCCISDGCVNVYNGKIARCPTLMYIDKFNEKFGTKLPNGGIMKLDDYSNGEELLDKLKQDVPLCKHCIRHDIEWRQCGREAKLDDFAVNS